MNKTKDNYLLRLIEFFFLILILVFASYNLKLHFDQNNVLGMQTEYVDINNQRLSFLKNLIIENPNYLEGYIEIAKLNIIDGNYEEARKYINLAKFINPNSLVLKILEEEVN